MLICRTVLICHVTFAVLVVGAALRGCPAPAFARELDSHMRYEEHLLFPAFQRSGVAAEFSIERLRPEHDDLRRQCRALDSELSGLSACVEQLQHLAGSLRDHKEREGVILYPWLASLRHPEFAWTSMPGPQPKEPAERSTRR